MATIRLPTTVFQFADLDFWPKLHIPGRVGEG